LDHCEQAAAAAALSVAVGPILKEGVCDLGGDAEGDQPSCDQYRREGAVSDCAFQVAGTGRGQLAGGHDDGGGGK
jgi:hypothetical protein